MDEWWRDAVHPWPAGPPCRRPPAEESPPSSSSALGNLREHGDGVPHADEVVGAEGAPHGRSAQVLVLVFAQSRDGLRGQAEGTEAAA